MFSAVCLNYFDRLSAKIAQVMGGEINVPSVMNGCLGNNV